MERVPIISTQLKPPAVKDRFIRRASLHKKLSQVKDYPLVLMHCGAGYGKSTALTLYEKDANLGACWYSIATSDDDLVPFLTKLIHSVQMNYPDFGQTIRQELNSLDRYVQDEQIWMLVSLMVNEINSLKDEVFIVLDDFHHVELSMPIEQWLIHFLEHIPPNCHLLLSSRNRPHWNILTSLKVKGNLLEITQEDLVFSQEEIEHLLFDHYELELSSSALEQLHELTEGWAIAFEMVIQQLQSGMDVNQVLQNRASTLQDLFDYMALEVLQKQSLMLQQFLMQTSILDTLSPKVCDYVLGMTGSEAMLEQLVNKQIFLQKLDHQHYRYHALFKVFLENRMKQMQKVEFEQINQKAARFYEQMGDLELALYHMEISEDYSRIAKLLHAYGVEMLKSGKLQSLYDRLLAIPDLHKRQFPTLWYYQGEILRYWSSYKEAEACYVKAETLGKEREDHYLLSLALEGKARIYIDTIQPDQAERYLHQAIEVREKTIVEKEEMARLYHMLAENLLNSGNAVRAEAWFQKANELDLPMEDGNLEARLYLRTGKLEKAEKVLLDRKNKQPFDESRHLPQSFRETDILLSIISAFLGKSKESKKFAEQGIHQGIQIQSPFVEACGWMRLGHAVQLMNRYEPELAERCYLTSLDMMEKLNLSRGKAEPYMGLCILHGMENEYEKAITMGEKGLHETELVKDLWLSSLIQLCMGIAAIYCGNFSEAKERLEAVEYQMEDCGDAYSKMLTSFWKAYIAYEQEDNHCFDEEMRQFLQRIQTGSYEFFFHKRTTFGPMDIQSIVPLLFKAQERNIQEHFVTQMIYDLGYGEIEHHPGYTLRVQTLGQLKLWLSNNLVEEKEWQREKAKEMFELFVTKRNQPLRKEEIFLALWPDQDEASANKSFKVALNALLKVLEPNRKARAESFFIKRDGHTYGLNPKARYELDLAVFEEWISMGLKENDPKQAREILERGLSLYNGDFLSERRTADWCLNERERLQVLYLRGAEKLAQVSVRVQDFDLCVKWCEAIIRADQTWEEAYRLIMYSYYQKNNRPQAMKWYKKCCDVLEEELGVEPMEPTQDMYKMIKEAKNVQVFA